MRIWPSGNRFEGAFRDGIMNGRGIIYFANGDRYEGEIVDGKRSGRGEDKRSNGE